MAAVVTEPLSTRTALTATGLTTLASATYVASNAYTTNGKNTAVEVELATTNAPAGNKKADVFIQESLDGTNFRTGPTSGTSTTREPNLKFVDSLPITTTATTERLTFDIKSALGYIPAAFKVIVKNDLGVALTTGNIYTSDVTPTIT